jgi:predicted Zn-dependent protease
MSIVSKAALTAILALGGIATVATTAPAAVQRKKKGEDEAPALKVGEEFRKAAMAAQTAIQAGDTATGETQLAAAEALVKNDDEKYFAAQLRLPLAARTKNNAGMKAAIETLLADPRTQDKGRLAFVRGDIARQEKDYPGAMRYLTQAQQLGYQDENLTLMMAQTQFDTGNAQAGVAELEKAVQAKKAAGQPVPDSWYDLAVARLYGVKDSAGVSKWLKLQLADYPTAKNWRRSLLVWRDSATLDDQGKLDLFRLMRQTKSLADQNDYLEYADIAYRVGLPFETKSVIDEGRAAGKVQSSGLAQLYGEAQQAIKVEGSLAALETKAKAGTGRQAANMGDAYLGSGNFTKAVEFYRLALQKGGVDAQTVNLRLGNALVGAGNKAEAATAFNGVTTQPKAEIATFWKQWLATPATGAATAAN